MTAPTTPAFVPAIEPIYETPTANAAVQLYDGQIRVEVVGKAFDLHGTVRMEWEPSPRIRFEVDEFDVGIPNALADLSEPTLHLLDTGGTAKASASTTTHLNATARCEMRGVVTDDLLIGNPCDVDEVIFHLPNFPTYLMGTQIKTKSGVMRGRLTEHTAEHLVEIDQLPDTADLVRKELRATRGYAITHVGRIRRKDQTRVRWDDVEPLLELLYWWCSFVRCERTGPMLVVGQLKNGTKVWEQWRALTVEPWVGRHTWFPDRFDLPANKVGAVELDPTLEVLEAIWRADDETKRAVLRSIEWLTQTVQTSYPFTGVVLAQAGLEVMSWLRLVVDGGLSADGFGKLEAADALRHALTLTSIATAVPASLPAVVAEAKQHSGYKEVDGPGAVTATRNAIVHPKDPKRFMDGMTQYYVGSLATQYLELLILHRLGYVGQFFDRLTWDGNPHPVPWAST